MSFGHICISLNYLLSSYSGHLMKSIPPLSVNKLGCVRGERLLFSDLSFNLDHGDVLQIKGPNGSGKTSLLHLLCGILRPHQGSIHWEGKDISALAEDYRDVVAFIGHKNAVKQRLTVTENIRIASMINGRTKNHQLDVVLKQFKLEKYRDTLAQELSAGQRQRIALARLVLACCRLWILDEPFTAVDVEGMQVMLSHISQHTKNGGMVIITTHNNSHLEKLSVHTLELS